MKRLIAFVMCFVLFLALPVFPSAYEEESGPSVPERPTYSAAIPEYSNINSSSITFYMVGNNAVVSYFVASNVNGINVTMQLYGGFLCMQKIGRPVNVSTGKSYISGECTIPAAGSGKYVIVVTIESGKDKTEIKDEFNYNADFAAGDANGDGVVRADDARRILRFAAKLDSYDSAVIRKCDINSDSKLTAADARIALRISARLL